ncbi:MAG: inorganic phosphate transporter [Sulfolobales archaeon]|nr:inorganic phosphate transporter [Sulfolobales archaeon]
MTNLSILIISFVAAFAVAWINGANNAANSIGAVVGSKAIELKKALFYGSLAELLGAILCGSLISMTLTRDIMKFENADDKWALIGMASAIIAATLWGLTSTILKIPISISQSIVAGVVGFSLMRFGVQNVNWPIILKILVSWILAPFISASIAFIAQKVVLRASIERSSKLTLITADLFLYTLLAAMMIPLFAAISEGGSLILSTALPLATPLALIAPLHLRLIKKRASVEGGNVNKAIFRELLLYASIAMAFSHGAHDAANAAGPLFIIMHASGSWFTNSRELLMLALLISGIGISLGVIMWGYTVVETIGAKITLLTPETGFLAQYAASIAIMMFVKLGIPVSTSACIVGGVMGVGLARGLKYVDYRLLGKIFAVWYLTIPVVASLSICISYVLQAFATT